MTTTSKQAKGEGRRAKGPGKLPSAYFYAALFGAAATRATTCLEKARSYRAEGNHPGEEVQLEWARRHGARAREYYASLRCFMGSGVAA